MIKDNIENKTLSIRISTDGFCFCGYTPSLPGSLKYFFYKPEKDLTLTTNLQKGVEQCPFKQCHKTFYRHCFPKNETRYEIVANRLNAQGITVLFPIEKALCEYIQQLGNTTFYSSPSILLGLITSKPVNESNYMLAFFQGDLAIYISIKDGKLQLANAFKNDCGQDCIYYLLGIWKEQGLSQENDTLYLCGDTGVEANIMTIGRFIKNCKRLNANQLFPSTLLNKMEGIPFDLQALILCE